MTQREWRLAAAVFFGVIFDIVADCMNDPTNHNL